MYVYVMFMYVYDHRGLIFEVHNNQLAFSDSNKIDCKKRNFTFMIFDLCFVQFDQCDWYRTTILVRL